MPTTLTPDEIRQLDEATIPTNGIRRGVFVSNPRLEGDGSKRKIEYPLINGFKREYLIGESAGGKSNGERRATHYASSDHKPSDFRIGDMIVGPSGSFVRVRRIGHNNLEGWLVEEPGVTEICKLHDVQRIARLAPDEHTIRIRERDVVMIPKLDHTERVVNDVVGDVVRIYIRGVLAEIPRSSLLLVRRPVQSGDRLHFVRHGSEAYEPWIASSPSSASRDDGSIVQSIAIGREGFDRWTHANNIPIDPYGEPVRDASGSIVGRVKHHTLGAMPLPKEWASVDRVPTVHDEMNKHVPSSASVAETIAMIRGEMDKHIHATGVGPGSPTQSTINAAKERGLIPMETETDAELRARCTRVLERLTNIGSKPALRELIAANLPIFADVDAALVKLLDEEKIARAIFQADPEVNEHVHRMVETPKIMINAKPAEQAAVRARAIHGFAVAWSRREPAGARERAEENAARQLEVLRFGVFEPLHEVILDDTKPIAADAFAKVTEEVDRFYIKLASAMRLPAWCFEPWAPSLRFR